MTPLRLFAAIFAAWMVLTSLDAVEEDFSDRQGTKTAGAPLFPFFVYAALAAGALWVAFRPGQHPDTTEPMARDHQHNPDPNEHAARIVGESTDRDSHGASAELEAAWQEWSSHPAASKNPDSK